ncbi:FAD-binding protein, partial [candidate division WOR-3 bacterium]|nr:FAD-binding protein [candidate division WOR-3 bacterium]
YADARGERHFDLGQEGGHHRRRIVHARDLTGLEIERGLLRAVYARPGVTVLQQHFATDLLLDEDGRCRGVAAIDEAGAGFRVNARVCMLATGGIGQVYAHTTNPPIATGDGIALAFRAGARVANMEFIQFHPTALHGLEIDGRSFLISEALRGEGAILRLRDGSTFMEAYHPDASLAPRDVVARAIAAETGRRGEEYVLLDATRLAPGRLRERFPNIHDTCLRFGIDISREPIPVVPAAHYVCGGVAVDLWGRTSVPGLFAAGECACTGLHGANRLASNSLLEALVFADRAAGAAKNGEGRGGSQMSEVRSQMPDGGMREAGLDAAGLRERLRRLMAMYAGIVRTDAGLATAERQVEELTREAGSLPGTVAARELLNMLAVARLVVASARHRPESRGLHYNLDHPQPEERCAHDTVVTKQASG